MKLLYDEMIHFTTAVLVGLICFFIFGNPYLILVAIAFGFLIDVDHLFDYFMYFGLRFSLKKFFQPKDYVTKSGKVYVLFHGWEYMLFFWLIGYWLGIPGLNWAIAGAYFFHLLWDEISFFTNPFTYFLIYRIATKFDFKRYINFEKYKCD